jgi:hypothetical protein
MVIIPIHTLELYCPHERVRTLEITQATFADLTVIPELTYEELEELGVTILEDSIEIYSDDAVLWDTTFEL